MNAPLIPRRSLAEISAAPAKHVAPHSDEALLALLGEMRAAWAHENALYASSRSAEDENVATAASEVTKRIIDRINATPATTMDGLRVKAQAVLWCCAGDMKEFANIFAPATSVDMQVITSILRDLIAGYGAGLPGRSDGDVRP